MLAAALFVGRLLWMRPCFDPVKPTIFRLHLICFDFQILGMSKFVDTAIWFCITAAVLVMGP